MVEAIGSLFELCVCVYVFEFLCVQIQMEPSKPRLMKPNVIAVESTVI